jgi:hypothetical protein
MMTDPMPDLTSIDPTRTGALDTLDPAASDDLRDRILATPRPVSAPGRARWIAAAAAIVAVATAGALLWPRAGAHPVTAVPAGTPTAATPATTVSGSQLSGIWRATAAPPLSPRYGSVTAWVDGGFVVVGGDATPPCPATWDCSWTSNYVRDGARYDPGTDTWSPIADAPVPLVALEGTANPYPLTAVLGDTLYVLTTELVGTEALLAWDAGTDQWRQLPLPADSPALTLVAAGDQLLAIPPAGKGRGDRYDLFNPATETWTSHVATGLPGPIGGVAVAGDSVVLAGLVDGDLARQWVAVLDPSTGTAHEVAGPGLESQRPTPLGLRTVGGGLAVWARAPEVVRFLEPATGTWSKVSRPAKAGTFTGQSALLDVDWHLTVAGMVALHGHLYDPVSQLWSPTPELPVLPDSPLLVAGDDSVLACFGFDLNGDLRKGKDCYLLRPEPASQPNP